MTNAKYTNAHTHYPQPDDVTAIVNTAPETFVNDNKRFISVGVHPWYISNYDLNTIFDEMKKIAVAKHVKAIGECGLDRLAETPMDVQEAVFVKQIVIAEAVKKPLIVHCVKAFEELIRIKKAQKITVPVIIHGYNNNGQIAEQLVKSGCYLSFGKALLTEGSNAQKIITQLEDERFFLETDNSDISIETIFKKASELKNTSPEELKEKMMLNFKKIFLHHE